MKCRNCGGWIEDCNGELCYPEEVKKMVEIDSVREREQKMLHANALILYEYNVMSYNELASVQKAIEMMSR